MSIRSTFRRLIFPTEWIYEIRGYSELLDIGSGSGVFLNILSENNSHVIGTEIRSKYFKKTYPLIVSPDKVSKRHFESVTLIDVLHHVKFKWTFLEELLNNFTPKTIIIKDMDDSFWFYTLMNRLHDFCFGHMDLISEVNELDLLRFMNEKGYKLQKKSYKRILWYSHVIYYFQS